MLTARAVTPDRWLAEGDTVTVAGHTFEVLHCPGHSPGSVVLVNRPQRFALVGDVLFQGSIGRTDLPYGDHEALINAIRTKLLPLGDEFAFICGHGPTSTIGHERRTNPFVGADARIVLRLKCCKRVALEGQPPRPGQAAEHAALRIAWCRRRWAEPLSMTASQMSTVSTRSVSLQLVRQ